MMSSPKNPNRTVVAFIHTHMPDGNLDPYLQSLCEAFVETGIALYVIKANDIVHNLASHTIKNSISEEKLVNWINQLNPDFIFNTNRAGITTSLMRHTSCPIITWMVDLVPFMHHGGDKDDLFCERDILITSTSSCVQVFEEEYPILKGRVHYMPVATSIKDFKNSNISIQDINVSFIGSLFDFDTYRLILNRYKNDRAVINRLLVISSLIRDNYNVNIDECLEKYDLEFLYRDLHLNSLIVKASIANTVSNNDRIKTLDAICDLGLKLYGTENWIDSANFSIDLLKCFQFSEYVNSRQKLVDIYQRSKISINVNHNQATDGLPYRIFDIMASNSLLITNYRKNSDIYTLFGEDVPVPMYRTPDELRELVQYFLNNESHRLEIVSTCQKLVQEGFNFIDCVNKFYNIIGIITDANKSDSGKMFFFDVAMISKKTAIIGNFINKNRKELDAIKENLTLSLKYAAIVTIKTIATILSEKQLKGLLSLAKIFFSEYNYHRISFWAKR